jgi:hypothetical protein
MASQIGPFPGVSRPVAYSPEALSSTWFWRMSSNETLRNVQSAWVKDMNVLIEDGQIRAYKVNLAITFVLEEGT